MHPYFLNMKKVHKTGRKYKLHAIALLRIVESRYPVLRLMAIGHYTTYDCIKKKIFLNNLINCKEQNRSRTV